MITIHFTQFLRPNGRQVPVTIEMRDEVAPKVKEIEACGCRLTAEHLRTGEVSFAIEEPLLGDMDVIVCANGPELVEPLHQMILRFSPQKFKDWLREME